MAVRQIPLAIVPAPAMSLDSFVPGPSVANAAVLAHLRAMPMRSGAPVYLWGASGSGKTHLLQALTASWLAQGRRAAWFDATTALPWTLEEQTSLIVLDGAEQLNATQQHAGFALFIETAAAGVQWAAAGALPPVDLPLRDDLRTRLAWGHVFALEALGESDARAVLRREADRRGIFLSDEVMGYLLTRYSRDLKHLMALLDRLDEFSLSEQRAITVPLLKRMFDEEGADLV
ncbi:MAG: DnaA regulatory inactivator Hda [Aquincola sp.]|nr:DnaA regulatory inactivator Hda [Aquincola sp.]MDH4289481.1 DnaA regulatory inactivator Hda [Aquincola sp.]MDH5331379.1 DnaA regulatory inactivator Hda [Aquincola sp.]